MRRSTGHDRNGQMHSRPNLDMRLGMSADTQQRHLLVAGSDAKPEISMTDNQTAVRSNGWVSTETGGNGYVILRGKADAGDEFQVKLCWPDALTLIRDISEAVEEGLCNG